MYRRGFAWAVLLAVLTGYGTAKATDATPPAGLAASYRFLVSAREQGGILYTATAGTLAGLALPLSFYDTADYWARHVCRYPSETCAVTNIYDPGNYTLEPAQDLAGQLQTERVNIHEGSNIYDAATWQIAVVLGAVANDFDIPAGTDAWALANHQNRLLQAGHSGNAPHMASGSNRAISSGDIFLYNKQTVPRPEQAFSFRMLARRWLAEDPFIDTPYASLISTTALPADNPAYKPGVISWTDWKAFTGENAWAFLIGPLQAAYIHHVIGRNSTFVPYADPAVQNALQVLPTFTAMQSTLGALYYAPSGTVRNLGVETVSPHEVSVENNASVLAGLKILRQTLQGQLEHERTLSASSIAAIQAALTDIGIMIDGGRNRYGRQTAGLLSFLKNHAWVNGEFVQGGLAEQPGRAWEPFLQPKAIDANTWTIAALGARQVDEWFGFGAAFRNWQHLKSWGGYGSDQALWGVGFSDQDGNGRDPDGNFRQGVLSAEWTAGAINLLRNLLHHYAAAPASAEAAQYLAELQRDEAAMYQGVQSLRYDNYLQTPFPGKPENYAALVPHSLQPYLYASRRYQVPFGWYANPLPSTCATAWMIMLANRYDPLGYAGKPN